MNVFAKIPFTYGGRDLERGEVLELKGYARDSQLLGLRYLIELPKDLPVEKCDMCGKRFAGHSFYIGHKKKPSCMAPSAEISPVETAELLGKDPKDVRVEE